jgi:biopolymer transport protein ExbD
MQFTARKHRQPPAVIIISLIDILIVLLIFLMVTTTFKQHPAVKLALPESRQAQQGALDPKQMVVVSISKGEPFFYLDQRPVTLARLQEELVSRAAQNPKIQLTIRGDKEAPLGEVIKAVDAAKAARIKDMSVLVKSGSQ